MTPSAGSYSMHYQTMDPKADTRMACQDSDIARKLSAAHQLGVINHKQIGDSGLIPQRRLPDDRSVKPQTTVGPWMSQQFPTDNKPDTLTPFSTGVNGTTTISSNISNTDNGSYQGYNVGNRQISFPANLPQVRCSPKPTIPLDRFRSVRDACQDGGFLSYEKYQEFTSMTVSNRRPQQMMFPGSEIIKDNVSDQTNSTFSLFPLSDIKPKEELSISSSTLAQDAMSTIPNSVANNAEMQLDFGTLSNQDLGFHGVPSTSAEISGDYLPMCKDSRKRTREADFSDPSTSSLDLQTNYSSLPIDDLPTPPKRADIRLLEVKSEKISETCDTEVPMEAIDSKG